MFWHIFLFELRYQLRRPLFYLVAFGLGLMAFGAVSSDTIRIGGAIGNVHRNAPFVITQMLAIFTPIGTFIITAFVASAALRDFELGTDGLFFSKPVRKLEYLLGRFAGALTIGTLVYLGPALGMLLGSFMPWIDPERLGPTLLSPYLAGFGMFVLPNMLFMGAVFFTVASLTRKWLHTYLGVIIFFAGFFLAQAMVGDVENKELASLMDPFGVAAFDLATRYWTIVERNTILPDFAGPLLYNRLLWTALGLAVLAFGCATFSFARRSKKSKKKVDDVEAATAGRGAVPLPRTTPSFDGATTLLQWRRSIAFEVGSVLRSVPFLVMLAFGLFNLVGSSQFIDRMFGTTVYPVTHLMVQGIRDSFAFLLLIIITFYAGELLWREHSAGSKDVFDAMPTRSGVFLGAKLVALSAVVLVYLGAGAITSMLIQLWKGYGQLEPLLYAKGLLAVGYPWLLICFLAVFLQVVSNNKFVGFLLMIVFMLQGIVFGALDFDHNLYQYAGRPGMPYSDMNGYGHFVTPALWFGLYWTFAAVALTALSALLWIRGRETAPRHRTRLFGQRFRGGVRAALAFGAVGFLATGGYIFYNTNVLNEYVPGDLAEERQADYEKRYSSYRDVPLPRLVAVKTDVDIFPYERRIEASGTYRIVNETDVPIRELPLELPRASTFRSLDLPPHTVELDDEVHGFRVVKLDEPLAPGAEMTLGFDIEVAPKGFVNGGSDTQIVYNGTFFNNRAYFPQLGYNEGRQLLDRNDRRKFGLEPVQRMADVDDLVARRDTYIGRDADWIDFETTVSTAGDQIAVAPGYLQKEWNEGGRRYFHYAMDAPILHFYSYLSARYEVHRDEHDGVAVEIYHHPGHDYNVERMVDGIKKSLDYFGTEFSPYQHRQMRILEFPRYNQFAQAFPNTVPFSESIGFIAKLDDEPDAIDYVFYVTAHEVAHQWWAHQVIGGNVQGATMLSETLAQYSALMVMEKEYGKAKMRRFLQFELDRYLQGRGGELIEEMPIMLVENQPYIHYRKGSLVMYALRDYLGEETLNRAIRAYVEAVAFQEPPFTHTPEFLDFIRAEASPEMAPVIADLFERITLFDNRLTEATYTERDDGTYLVRLETASGKVHADGQGVETPTDLDDWVDVAVFGEEQVDGRTEQKVLFLEKRRLTEADSVFEVVVSEKPVQAGIDPFNKLVDRNSDDNVKRVVEASGAAATGP